MRERVDVELLNHTTAIVAESKLLTVRTNIEKNKEKNITDQATLMGELRTKARACKRVAKEQRVLKLRKLLPLLQRCKRYRQQTVLADQQLGLLDLQINAFENGRFQKEMTDTLRASVAAMKQVGISDDDVGDVDSMVVDMEERLHQQQQVSESLSSSMVNTMDDATSTDDSLMRELMMLMGDDDEVTDTSAPITRMTATSSAVVVLPPTPVSVMHQPLEDIEQDKEEELEPTTRVSEKAMVEIHASQ